METFVNNILKGNCINRTWVILAAKNSNISIKNETEIQDPRYIQETPTGGARMPGRAKPNFTMEDFMLRK